MSDPKNIADHDNSLINRLGRESQVLGLGIGEGMVDGVANISSHWQQAVESASAGYRPDALNHDGTIFGSDGKPITGANGDPVRVRSTFKAIDVKRWQQHGIDSNGAGIDRFKGDDIKGAAVVQPKLDTSGKPIELRRYSKGAQGKATVAKEVVGTVGEVPDGVESGMSLGNLMRRFDPDQIARRAKPHPQLRLADAVISDPNKR